MFTYQYKQPDSYHFSLDSIHLAEFVAEQLQSCRHLPSMQVLDLCAGCGVIGMELSWYVRELKYFDFVEVQSIYAESFQQNAETVNRPELQLNWHNLNYETLLESTWTEKYDLIVSNPPYFQPGHGTLSPCDFKNRCRFFLDSSFEHFILAIVNSLKKQGQAWFLLRSLLQHGYDAFAIMQKILRNTQTTATKVTKIRGTDVILLKKN